MFKSLGNLLVNPQVGLLFIDFESPKRLRVNGRATVHEDDPLLAELAGAQLDRARAGRGDLPELPALHPHDAAGRESVYAPCEGHTPPVPEWKQRADVPRGAAAGRSGALAELRDDSGAEAPSSA